MQREHKMGNKIVTYDSSKKKGDHKRSKWLGESERIHGFNFGERHIIVVI